MTRRWPNLSVVVLLAVAAAPPAAGLPLPGRLAAVPPPVMQVAMRDFTLHFDHALGVEEAHRRIAAGIERLRQRFAGKIAKVDVDWHGNDADVRVAAMSQTANGHIAITDNAVDLRVHLPLLLSPFAEQASKVLNKDTLKALK